MTFEFDKGFTVQVPTTLGFRVPLAGGGPGGIIDGQRFSVDDGRSAATDPVTFEFDTNNNWSFSNRRVSIPVNATADQIAAAMVAALTNGHLPARDSQGNLLTIQPRSTLVIPLQPRDLGGGLVHVGATEDHLVSVGNSVLTTTITQTVVSLQVPVGGGAVIQDNESFIVTNGPISFTFELSNNGLTPTIPGSIVIPYLATDSADAIATTIAGFLLNPLSENPAVNRLNLQASSAGGGLIEIVALTNHRFDMSRTQITRQLNVGGVRDGETLTIRNGANAVVFEFDNDGNVGNNTIVPFSASDTHVDIADRLAISIQSVGIGIDPDNAGNGILNLGGTLSHTIQQSDPFTLLVSGAPGASPSTTLELPSLSGLEVSPLGAAAFSDGDTFTITNGNNSAHSNSIPITSLSTTTTIPSPTMC